VSPEAIPMSPILPAPELQPGLTKARQQHGEVEAVGDIGRGTRILKSFSIEVVTGLRKEKRVKTGNPELLGHAGLGALQLGGKRIEIDELGIIGGRLALVFTAAMDMHQGLHAPCVQIIHVLMPQRNRQQRLR
jgi:hypothetical protein